MDEVKTDNSEIASLTRERDELKRRLEKWQRNEVQIATNQQVARLIRERDEARAEAEKTKKIRDQMASNWMDWQRRAVELESERHMLKAEVERLRDVHNYLTKDDWIESLKRDAERYRWLKAMQEGE